MGDTSLQPSIQVFATLGFIDHRLGWRLRETFWTRVSVLTDMALPALAYDHLLWVISTRKLNIVKCVNGSDQIFIFCQSKATCIPDSAAAFQILKRALSSFILIS